jgi:hypothetical protein
MSAEQQVRVSGVRAAWWITMPLCASLVACAAGGSNNTGGGGADLTTTTTTTTSTTDTGSTTGSASLCKQDCSQIKTPQCLMAVCNDGSYPGTVGDCVVVPAPAGNACDDGQFCTVEDTCDGAGTCVGGPQNDCGLTPPECALVTCDELAKQCSTGPADDGTDCAPSDLCKVNGVCTNGICIGEVKDCSFDPAAECNTVSCNPSTGACEGTPDSAKNGAACSLSGDLCMVGRTCSNGACGGGNPKDCSSLTKGCKNGVCDAASGACVAQPVPTGGNCTDGIDQCHVGICSAAGSCDASPIADGTACNDSNPCTAGDVCTAGTCAGTPSTGCVLYYSNGFETCPGGWTLREDWACGTPTMVGPAAAHAGTRLLGTVLNGNYSSDDSFTTTTADSPSIDLTNATSPQLSFYAWINTERSTSSSTLYDGFTIQVSSNNGSTFSTPASVLPPSKDTIGTTPAWGGDQSAAGWQHFVADLTPYKGKHVIVRFAMESDFSSEYPGVYIDDLLVGEASAIPLSISTAAIDSAYAGTPYTFALARAGGASTAIWSITGGINHGWLTIDPVTGALSGTPALANVGPVTLNVKIAEPSVPGNIATATFNFNVYKALYAQSFEGACPNGWTLGGDWECGKPVTVGPATAYSGQQCLATKIASTYSLNQSWTVATATSPDISLVGAAHPQLSFRMWVYTESTFDGANLKISADGGATYSLVANVTPAYDQSSVGGEKAWGGDKRTWRLVTADLSSFIGQTVRLRFAFHSDGSQVYDGVYIDDVTVTDN